MIGRTIGGAALLIASPAIAQEQTPATGSPSNATATVSSATASSALDRPASGGSSFDVSLGTSYASGDFGSASHTGIWSTSFAARYASSGGLRLSASLPYMRIRSSGTIFTGIDSTPVVIVGAGPGPRVTSSGFGDLTLGASYTLDEPASGAEVELSGRVKLPTAKRSSMLSSGKTDYSAGVQLSKTVGRLAPFISASYRVLGNPQGLDLRNGLAASVGASLVVGDKTVLLASYHFAQAATRLVANSHELFAGASTQLGQSRLRLTGFATAGLSAGAPGVSSGVAISMKL